MCPCEDSDTVALSDDSQGECVKIQSVRDNPTFAPVALHRPVAVDGAVNCDEWVGMVERNLEVRSDHMDVLWGYQPELEPSKGTIASVREVTGAINQEPVRDVIVAENQEQVLELKWKNQVDKDIDLSSSNLNLREESVQFTTALTYSESDLVPVPVSIVPSSVLPEVHVVVTNGVARETTGHTA
ncbi:hypothetical protein V6N12_068407 [Hibiscus sabdariffa]|uniref:Uncharacterized protein n=1 Tax=Hibiscus sabdariffa TaxID=183260 RepID=A0ABR2FQ74_9ROSI